MVLYTKHAEEKLKRKDIKGFNITKVVIEKALQSSKKKTSTKFGERSAVSPLSSKHDLRVVYDIIEDDIKVITFHIARKGRY